MSSPSPIAMILFWTWSLTQEKCSAKSDSASSLATRKNLAICHQYVDHTLSVWTTDLVQAKKKFATLINPHSQNWAANPKLFKLCSISTDAAHLATGCTPGNWLPGFRAPSPGSTWPGNPPAFTALDITLLTNFTWLPPPQTKAATANKWANAKTVTSTYYENTISKTNIFSSTQHKWKISLNVIYLPITHHFIQLQKIREWEAAKQPGRESVWGNVEKLGNESVKYLVVKIEENATQWENGGGKADDDDDDDDGQVGLRQQYATEHWCSRLEDFRKGPFKP
ncbi:hypothetical protein B0H10DRAFT_1962562 [Mycena sp. CBHHK59/15]|nr:hypothetical protein B0H10DRAFT_1962562 [Mycena sp. CBHHK59/15]